MSQPRTFPFGALVITAAAEAALDQASVVQSLRRHLTCDWGDLDPEDRAVNERALKEGKRLFSAYSAADGTRFYIITEPDRSYTTVLLPEDY
jgi:hypothetical protein